MSMNAFDYLLFDAVEDDKTSTAELLFTLADNAESADAGMATTAAAAVTTTATTEDSKPLTENPLVIKGMQDDLQELDVIVCGRCHTVYHFVEQFQEHRANSPTCRGSSTFKASISESKPHVWAFLLWKNAQTKILGDTESSWKLYQRWCKMDDQLRETWIAAGRDLQANSMMVSHLRMEAANNKNGKSKTSSIYSILEDDEDIRLRPYRRHETSSHRKVMTSADWQTGRRPTALTIRRMEDNGGGGGGSEATQSYAAKLTTSTIASPIDEAQFHANIDALYYKS